MSSVNMTSLSHPHCTYYMYDVFTNWFFVIINVLMAITTVVSNAFVFLTVFKTKSLQRPANLLLCSLALCDFAVGFVVQPLGVTLRVAEIVCVNSDVYKTLFRAYSMSIDFFGAGSVLQVCVMCWDCYKAVPSPLKYRATVTNKRMMTTIAVTWCAWGSWCFFTNYLVAEFDKILFIIVGGMVFLLMPAISQVAILKAVRRQNREIAPAATNCITVTRAREKKMMVTVRYILALVFGSVVPPTLTGIATVITGSSSAQTFLSPFPMTMFCLSSCLNPLVYFWRHLDMRSAALALSRSGAEHLLFD